MVDFGSGQDRSDFATAGVAALRRGFQRARTPARVEKCRLWMDSEKSRFDSVQIRPKTMMGRAGEEK